VDTGRLYSEACCQILCQEPEIKEEIGKKSSKHLRFQHTIRGLPCIESAFHCLLVIDRGITNEVMVINDKPEVRISVCFAGQIDRWILDRKNPLNFAWNCWLFWNIRKNLAEWWPRLKNLTDEKVILHQGAYKALQNVLIFANILGIESRLLRADFQVSIWKEKGLRNLWWNKSGLPSWGWGSYLSLASHGQLLSPAFENGIRTSFP
jgi:hypothetical protein